MIRLAVRVARADAEVVLAELLELVPAGVEEVDRGDSIEYAVYGAPGELPALPAVRAAAGSALVDVTTTEVADDWSTRWRSFHRPVTIGERLHVRPPWHDPLPTTDGRIDMVIDPGNAFGTGAHPTTRLCLEALLDLEPGGALVDLGCGSGVLAIAAAKLGWSPVLAVDQRDEALEVTAMNAVDNGVDITVRRFDLGSDGPAPAESVVLANLLRPTIARLAASGFAHGDRVQTLVVSGVLPSEADCVVAMFAIHGLEERMRRECEGWAMSVLSASVASRG